MSKADKKNRIKVINSTTTRGILSKLYQVDERLIKTWLSDLGIHHQRNLSSFELSVCVLNWGTPDSETKIDLPLNEIPKEYIKPLHQIDIMEIKETINPKRQ